MKEQPIYLPKNNVEFPMPSSIFKRTDILREFINKHNALYKEYNAVRIENRFYSANAYLFFKVEENLLQYFIEQNPLIHEESINKYYAVVSRLVEIIEHLKIHS